MKSIVTLLLAGVFAVLPLRAEKPRITSQDQLPRFSYPLSGRVTATLDDPPPPFTLSTYGRPVLATALELDPSFAAQAAPDMPKSATAARHSTAPRRSRPVEIADPIVISFGHLRYLGRWNRRRSPRQSTPTPD